jgi:hypothetical protein
MTQHPLLCKTSREARYVVSSFKNESSKSPPCFLGILCCQAYCYYSPFIGGTGPKNKEEEETKEDKQDDLLPCLISAYNGSLS